MNQKLKSTVRGVINQARRTLIKDKKTQKLLAVRYNNLQVMMHGNRKPIDTTFDVQAIMSGPQKFYCDEKYHGNVHFGIAKAIKDYAGIHGCLNCCIEHGVYFGDYVAEDEAVDSGFPKLITFGRQRVEHLKKVSNVEIIPIGPYIYYASPSLSDEEIETIHKKNGKTLLVFPTHSIDRVDMEFDTDLFIQRIEAFQRDHGFEKVMVCLFYKDIMLGREKAYMERGFQVVSAGYRDDPMFLRRLKSFILLSDYTASNDVGTHVGYCVSLGKPHIVFEQAIKPKPYTKNDLESVTNSFNDTVQSEKTGVQRAFSAYQSDITPDQYQLVERFWGTDYLRNRDELKKLLID